MLLGRREYLRECARTLRIVLIQRDISRLALAQATNLAPQTIYKMASGFQAGRKSQALVENVLGVPVWSTRDDFEERRRLSEGLGFDPLLANKPELLNAVRVRKIPGRGRMRGRKDLFALLLRHFVEEDAVRPARQRTRKIFARGRAMMRTPKTRQV